MNIVLCGMMGCGKTTVAAALSKLYGMQATDTDEIIVSRYGDISTIFKERGEEYFRAIEQKVVEEAASTLNNAVISLGGGCVLKDSNVRALKKSGKIFYLRAQPSTIVGRLRGDKTRPLLAGDITERVNSILKQRQAIYERVADCIIDVDGSTPEEIAKSIMESV